MSYQKYYGFSVGVFFFMLESHRESILAPTMWLLGSGAAVPPFASRHRALRGGGLRAYPFVW